MRRRRWRTRSGAFAELIKAGKVRAIGASNYSAPRLAEALDVAEQRGPAALREPAAALQPLRPRRVRGRDWSRCAVERGVGVINFYALAAGFLTGKYRSEADAAKSARGANTTKKYLNPRGLRILDALDAAAKAHGATPGQVAIAWQIARPGDHRADRQRHLAEAARRTGRPRPASQLDAETIAALDAASAEGAGQR